MSMHLLTRARLWRWPVTPVTCSEFALSLVLRPVIYRLLNKTAPGHVCERAVLAVECDAAQASVAVVSCRGEDNLLIGEQRGLLSSPIACITVID